MFVEYPLPAWHYSGLYRYGSQTDMVPIFPDQPTSLEEDAEVSTHRAREMAQWLRALAALPEDPSSVPNTHE